MLLRSALLFLSRSRTLRRWVENSPLARKLTGRFVAGLTLEDGLAACAKLNQEGILATLDHLGENVSSIEEAAATRDAYLTALDSIANRKLKSTVSIKLTHFGLDFSEEICAGYVEAVVALAKETANAVEIDMESAPYVDRTLNIVHRQHQSFGCVRAVVQAYLRRSEKDISDLSRAGIPVRLCKGAYNEPPEIAIPRKAEVDLNYLRLTAVLLREGVYPALATHDERIIRDVVRMTRDARLAPDRLEFQMLYGIRKSLQRQLVRDGFRVRLYVPYGVAWYPYFMRRLAERPANLLFLLRNLVRS
jgi:proline dehydrogenase